MIVSASHRFVFAHVPRTGGISMRAALTPYVDPRLTHLPAHGTLDDLAAAHPGTGGYFKFAFVRHPWDRLVSFYTYARNVLARTLPQIESFDGLLRAVDRDEPWTRGIFALRPQGDFVAGTDFTGRFERLAADFAQVCARLGIAPDLGRRNAFAHPPYAQCYDDWSRGFVAERYRRDIEEFDYRFEAPP